jgi:probable F420-dependent oxidoreductase
VSEATGVTATGLRTILRLPVAGEAGSHPRELIDAARRAEPAGFDAVSISDHVVMGPRADRYPWGAFPFAPEEPWYEPLTVLAAIAASTERIGLTTSILIVPLRPAALLAKWAATLDVVSGGRLSLGVGTGWQREEFEALGVPFEERGPRLTDAIAACRALWGADPARVERPTVSFSDIWCHPKPVGGRRLPILFSGTLTARNVARIVELGDGWIPIMGERREGIEAGVTRLRREMEAAGRDPAALAVRSAVRVGRSESGAPDLRATLERSRVLADIGVTDLDLPLSLFVGEKGPARAGALRRFFAEAEELLGAAR